MFNIRAYIAAYAMPVSAGGVVADARDGLDRSRSFRGATRLHRTVTTSFVAAPI